METNELQDRVFRLYTEIGLGSCPHRDDCFRLPKAEVPRPISIWHVGTDFATDEHRILFVGKTARGTPGEPLPNGTLNATKTGLQLLSGSLPNSRSWHYWSYTREILRQVYGDETVGIKRIAFTNLVKCNNSDGVDQTTKVMAKNCIEEMRVVFKEIGVLRPKVIILYTGVRYDQYLTPYVPDGEGVIARDLSAQDHRVKVGNKDIPWWEREYIDVDGNVILCMLRTSHPERKNKHDFTARVANFILRR